MKKETEEKLSKEELTAMFREELNDLVETGNKNFDLLVKGLDTTEFRDRLSVLDEDEVNNFIKLINFELADALKLIHGDARNRRPEVRKTDHI